MMTREGKATQAKQRENCFERKTWGTEEELVQFCSQSYAPISKVCSFSYVGFWNDD